MDGPIKCYLLTLKCKKHLIITKGIEHESLYFLSHNFKYIVKLKWDRGGQINFINNSEETIQQQQGVMMEFIQENFFVCI
jgi:hypothetical protein